MAEALSDTFEVPGVPRARVFAYLAEPSNGAHWATFAQRIIGHGEPRVGQRVEARVGFLNVTFGIDATVTTHDAPRQLVLTGTSPFDGEIGARLDALADGTRVHAHLEVDPGRFFPVPGIVFRRALRRQFDTDVANLRRELRTLA